MDHISSVNPLTHVRQQGEPWGDTLPHSISIAGSPCAPDTPLQHSMLFDYMLVSMVFALWRISA